MENILNKENGLRIFLILLILIFGIMLLRTAWVCDDAYIVFKTVGNFIHGYGLRFNIAERVQSYTSPLWMFLLSFFYFFTREPYYTSIFLSLSLSLVAVFILVFRIARNEIGAITAMLVLIFSKAFIDYSTSGLENPLLHFILAIYLYVFLKYELSERKLLYLSLITSFGALVRMDALLLFLPALIYTTWQTRKAKAFYLLGAGFLPFILWEGFSLLYYGFLFPNTAYAKIGTGIPQLELIQQGFYYLLNSLGMDPLTLLVISFAIIISFFKKDKNMMSVVAGIIFYIFYTVWIGGDFMSGRFLAAPLFLAVVLISRFELSSLESIVIPVAIVILGFSSPHPSLLSSADYRAGVNPWSLIDNKGICDERAFYYPQLGLLNAHRGFFTPHMLRWGGGATHSSVVMTRSNGAVGYTSGPSVHVVDEFALVDPLLARLPVVPNPDWRIGHFVRAVPTGYLETLKTGKNKIKNKKLALYYEKLSLLTRGKIFDKKRLIEILRFNLGLNNYLVSDQYLQEASIKELAEVKREGTPWDSPGNRLIIPGKGLWVDLEYMHYAKKIEISLDNNDEYLIWYLRDQRVVANQKVSAKSSWGLAVHLLKVPAQAVKKGYDSLKILPTAGDGRYSLGHIRFID